MSYNTPFFLLFPLFSHLPINYEAFYWKRGKSSARPVSYCLAVPAQMAIGRLNVWFPWDLEKICTFPSTAVCSPKLPRAWLCRGVPGTPSAASGTGPGRQAVPQEGGKHRQAL